MATAVDEQADYTNRFAPPVLETLDEGGRPRSAVRHNPLYAAVHREVYERGIVGLNYGPERRPYVLTFAMGYLLAQSDISIHCPVTLTGAVAHVLDRFTPEAVRNANLPALVRMDGRAATGGTWVTEKQGGSDVGATATTARRTDGGIVLNGLKWFASNVDGGLALTLARPEGAAGGSGGLGLYLVPARGPDGAPNRYRIRRLKDKLGTRGLATGEIELEDAHAVEVAPPPDGLRTMMAALGYSRVHNAMASAGIQRRAFAEALAHAETRSAFGQRLIAYPMVQDQLVEMQVRLEASVALAFAAARAFDAALSKTDEQPWIRLVTALAKYLTAEWAITATSRAIEILGGNGYTEEYPTARLYRDAQVLTVWKGRPTSRRWRCCASRARARRASRPSTPGSTPSSTCLRRQPLGLRAGTRAHLAGAAGDRRAGGAHQRRRSGGAAPGAQADGPHGQGSGCCPPGRGGGHRLGRGRCTKGRGRAPLCRTGAGSAGAAEAGRKRKPEVLPPARRIREDRNLAPGLSATQGQRRNTPIRPSPPHAMCWACRGRAHTTGARAMEVNGKEIAVEEHGDG